MTKITHIAAVAGLLAALSTPAFAGDQDVYTELRDSGRYVPEASLPEWNHANPAVNGRSVKFRQANEPYGYQSNGR